MQERAARSEAAQHESYLIVGSDADLVLGGLSAMLRNVYVPNVFPYVLVCTLVGVGVYARLCVRVYVREYIIKNIYC